MGATASIPIISQAKSAIQAVAGDTEGAKETQVKFINTCFIISQGKSFIHWCAGDNEAAWKTQTQFVKGLGDFVDGVPVVGHIKGGIHYAYGDREGGDQAMKSASRTVGVMGGAAIGGLIAGPVGAVAGGIAGGASLDGITTGVDSAIHGEFRPSGQVAAVTGMIKGEATVGDYFDSVTGIAFDGITGYEFRKAAKNLYDARTNMTLYRVAEKSEVKNVVTAGKLPKRPGSETWLTENVEHSKSYIKSRKYKDASAYELKYPAEKYNKLKEDMIDQHKSREKQSARIKEGKRPANIFNKERLQNDPHGRLNIGIVGDKNLEEFNKHVHGIREIDPNGFEFKNGFTQGLYRYGASATSIMFNSSGMSRNRHADKSLSSQPLQLGHLDIGYGDHFNFPKLHGHNPFDSLQLHALGKNTYGHDLLSGHPFNGPFNF